MCDVSLAQIVSLCPECQPVPMQAYAGLASAR